VNFGIFGVRRLDAALVCGGWTPFSQPTIPMMLTKLDRDLCLPEWKQKSGVEPPHSK
jgi:hypothetical protein